LPTGGDQEQSRARVRGLTTKIGRLDRQAGDVSARPRQARDHPAADWVQRQSEDNWDYGCRLLCREDRASRCDNDVDLKLHKLGRDLGVTLSAAFRPAKYDCNITTLDPTEVA